MHLAPDAINPGAGKPGVERSGYSAFSRTFWGVSSPCLPAHAGQLTPQEAPGPM